MRVTDRTPCQDLNSKCYKKDRSVITPYLKYMLLLLKALQAIECGPWGNTEGLLGQGEILGLSAIGAPTCPLSSQPDREAAASQTSG